jgi:hypothetical protein
MKYKLLLVSLLVLMTLATVPQSLKHFSEGISFSNHWAMAVLFWSNGLDSPATVEKRAACLTPETTEVTNAAPVTPGDQEEFRWQGRVNAGQAVEIKGVNGNVRAEGYNGNQVEVVASKTSRRSDIKSVEIRVLEHAGGVTICAVYPSDEQARPNDCQPGKGGRMSVHDNDVEVNFTVRVPTGVRFVGRTVNGEVEANRIGSDVDVSTVNGDINVSASGIAQAATINGSIKAVMGSANWASELKFNTINGSITLDFPSSLNADVRAETLNGDVSSDFPMNIQSTQEERRGRPKRVFATIGSGGGHALVLKTINGDIRLQRAAERAM